MRSRASFHDNVAVGQRLRVFGATIEPEVAGRRSRGAGEELRAMPVAAADSRSRASNYRRWVNFPWAVVEAGGQNAAG